MATGSLLRTTGDVTSTRLIADCCSETAGTKIGLTFKGLRDNILHLNDVKHGGCRNVPFYLKKVSLFCCAVRVSLQDEMCHLFTSNTRW